MLPTPHFRKKKTSCTKIPWYKTFFFLFIHISNHVLHRRLRGKELAHEAIMIWLCKLDPNFFHS